MIDMFKLLFMQKVDIFQINYDKCNRNKSVLDRKSIKALNLDILLQRYLFIFYNIIVAKKEI